jgi:glycogen operon protein
MLLAGDEFGRSQGGNNNAYCQDNALNWINWNRDARGEAILEFTRRLTQLRAKHPALHHDRFLGRFDFPEDPRDLVWLTIEGKEMDGNDWNNEGARVFGMLIDVPGREDLPGRDIILLLFNGGHEAAEFTVPKSPRGVGWQVLLDTSQDFDSAFHVSSVSERYKLADRSAVILEALESQ